MARGGSTTAAHRNEMHGCDTRSGSCFDVVKIRRILFSVSARCILSGLLLLRLRRCCLSCLRCSSSLQTAITAEKPTKGRLEACDPQAATKELTRETNGRSVHRKLDDIDGRIALYLVAQRISTAPQP